MNILVLGDVVSLAGCSFVRKKLPALKKLKAIDFCIANGENSAKGNGITPESAEHLFSSGVDFITGGNHSFRRQEIYDFLDEREDIIRPYNFPKGVYGKGVSVIDTGRARIAVINLMGTMFMGESLENPFYAVDKALAETDGAKIILVDFHAEATSEKKALGYYLDGKISAFFGTHTHIQTADEIILKGKTGYITDLGMCGVEESVLGVNKDTIIKKFRTNLPQRFDTAEDGDCILCGCIFSVDEKSGKCTDIERIYLR